MSFSLSFSASPQPPEHRSTAYVTNGFQRQFSVVVTQRGRSYVDDEYTEPAVSEAYQVPLFCLCDPSRWMRLVSKMLGSFRFYYGTEAYAQLLSALCTHAPAEVANASPHGFMRLDVAVDVVQQVVVDRLPPPRHRRRGPLVVLADPIPPPPPTSPQVGGDIISAPLSQPCYGMKAKEVNEIDPEETCPICFEEYLRESTTTTVKEVIETPCSHLFHSDCLLTWFNNANTCPLCRRPLCP